MHCTRQGWYKNVGVSIQTKSICYSPAWRDSPAFHSKGTLECPSYSEQNTSTLIYIFLFTKHISFHVSVSSPDRMTFLRAVTFLLDLQFTQEIHRRSCAVIPFATSPLGHCLSTSLRPHSAAIPYLEREREVCT